MMLATTWLVHSLSRLMFLPYWLTGAGLNSIGKAQQHGLKKGSFATNKGGEGIRGRSRQTSGGSVHQRRSLRQILVDPLWAAACGRGTWALGLYLLARFRWTQWKFVAWQRARAQVLDVEEQACQWACTHRQSKRRQCKEVAALQLLLCLCCWQVWLQALCVPHKQRDLERLGLFVGQLEWYAWRCCCRWCDEDA